MIFIKRIKDIEQLIENLDGPILIAIDGKCAAGKTTYGNFLKETYGANLFHMDDFFLQSHQRTNERLIEVGGNVDYERFRAEVIIPLLDKKDVVYRPYSCSEGRISKEYKIEYKKLNIIEGAYSGHPYFHDCYHYRIFLDVVEAVQIERIKKRNGSWMLNRFINEWIPKENEYFNKYHIKEKSNLVMDLI